MCYLTTRISCMILLVLVGLSAPPVHAEEQHPKYKTGHFRKIDHQQYQMIKEKCPADSYVSQISSNQETVFINCEGKKLYGSLDSNGYGELKDDEGTIVKVQPGLPGR